MIKCLRMSNLVKLHAVYIEKIIDCNQHIKDRHYRRSTGIAPTLHRQSNLNKRLVAIISVRKSDFTKSVKLLFNKREQCNVVCVCVYVQACVYRRVCICSVCVCTGVRVVVPTVFLP